jgi:hypothetical protein
MWSGDDLRKRAKGDKKAKNERARVGAGVSSERDLYEARSTLITIAVEDGIGEGGRAVDPRQAGPARPRRLFPAVTASPLRGDGEAQLPGSHSARGQLRRDRDQLVEPLRWGPEDPGDCQLLTPY